MNIFFIIGTRPEIIKCFSVYREAKRRGHNCLVYYTNQNFTKGLRDKIFNNIDYDDDVVFYDGGRVWNGMFNDIDNHIASFNPDVALVQGDTWSCLYGVIAVEDIPLGHIEAGLRSFDKRMIEEKIRVAVDNLSDFLFCTTETAQENIMADFNRDSYLVGNTLYDLLKEQQPVERKDFMLATLHRPETVDEPVTLQNTLYGLRLIAKEFKTLIKFYVHPRTVDKMEMFNITPCKSVIVKEPLGYINFIEQLNSCKLAITDSGGIQEECAILQTPCITCRKSTERPETVEAGYNIVCGNKPKDMLAAAKRMMSRKLNPCKLYGSGNTGKKIIKILEEEL